MRKRYAGFVVGASLVVAAAAGVVGQGFSPDVGGAGTQLAQFPGGQAGSAPGPGGIRLGAAEEGRLALYCIDLFNDSPTDRDEYRSVPDDRALVATAAGRQIPLDEALSAGLLSVRGHDPLIDPPRRDGREWIDLYVRNNSDSPVTLTYPAGYTFMPKGRPAPTLAPGLVRMLESASRAGMTGSDTLAYAMWASRGFTRRDVEETEMRPVPDREAAAVQKLLDAGGIEQRFDRDPQTYERLYAARAAALGDTAEPFTGTAALVTGAKVTVSGRRAPSGIAVLAVQPPHSTETLRYAARVRSWSDNKAELELIHLKTGRKLAMNDGRLVVRLSGA